METPDLPNFTPNTKLFTKEERFDHLKYALDHVTLEGLYMEFGVWEAESIKVIAHHIKPEKVYGFDSFEGLPEQWLGLGAGHFATQSPSVPKNVELVKGWFNDTLPGFPKQTVAFLHVDCDLYSSTKTILEQFRSHIVPGTVIVFDEYYNYGTWREHEYKAFQEFIQETGLQYEYLGRTEYLETSVIIR